MEKKKKVLFCYTELLHYRVEVLDSLAKKYDVTVVHSGEKISDNRNRFHEIVLPLRSIWKFRIQFGLLKIIRKDNFDAIIFFADLAWLSIMFGFLMCPRNSRRITWGLWRTKFSLANRVRLSIANFADANVFYSDKAANDFKELGIPNGKIFVARNTYAVRNPVRNEKTNRDCFLFVGSFNSRKQNDITVLAFSKAVLHMSNAVRLVFVGDGPERSSIEKLATSLPCANRIEFHPGETDQSKIREYYDKSICSVSFGQAGLSVLQSFGHGVPFVTRSDAISGGEIENIIDGYNGVLSGTDQDDLESIFLKLGTLPNYSAQLGRNALNYYQTKASVDVMNSGFISAIESSPKFN